MHRANWNKELLFFFPQRIKWVFALQLKAVPQLVLYNEYTIITGAVRHFFFCFIFYLVWVKVMRKEVIWRRSIWKCNWPLVRFCWNGIRYCSENTAFPLKFLMSRLWSSCLVSGPDRSSPQLAAVHVSPVSWHLETSATQQASHPFMFWKRINRIQVDCFQREATPAIVLCVGLVQCMTWDVFIPVAEVYRSTTEFSPCEFYCNSFWLEVKKAAQDHVCDSEGPKWPCLNV